MYKLSELLAVAAVASTSFALAAAAQPNSAAPSDCPVSHEQLVNVLHESVKPAGGPSNGGFDNNEWATVVDRAGVVCAVAFSGGRWDDQWPGSRAISAEKAFTANAFSLNGVATSTANLFWPSQPGGILSGIITSNPINTAALYSGSAKTYGSATDPLVGERLGGISAFGGGLPLYKDHVIVGGIGASGDSSCADHNVAWRLRKALSLGDTPKGVSGKTSDAIIYDIGTDGRSESGFGHPKCNGTEPKIAHEIGAAAGPNLN